MIERPRAAIDVDGVAGGLIPAFVGYMNERFRLDVRLEDIVYHNDMGRSPRLAEVDEKLRRDHYPIPENGLKSDSGWGGAFLEFMRNPRVYSDFVKPEPGAQEAIEFLKEKCQPLFLTALMKRANAHMPDKMDWIGKNFPGVPIATFPSELKQWVYVQMAFDDRYDTCQRFFEVGTTVFPFRQPWSEAPVGAKLYDGWREIIPEVKKTLPKFGVIA